MAFGLCWVEKEKQPGSGRGRLEAEMRTKWEQPLVDWASQDKGNLHDENERIELS